MKVPKIRNLIWILCLVVFCCACGKTEDHRTSTEGTVTAIPQESEILATQGSTVTMQNSENSAISQDAEEQEAPQVVYPPDSYDSQDTAILVSKNSEEGTVTLYNMDVDKQYTLSVTGTSTLYDKHGAAVSLEQIEPGDIVDITFLKDIKRLNSMQISPQSWSNEAASRYQIDWVKNSITIGKDVYKFTEDTLFLSQGKKIEQMDLNSVDVLTFQGIGSDILSVVVEKGHGYLRLENDTNFIGGFIEVGQSMITLIKEDMLLTVPEGSYQVLISHNGGGGTKNVTIERGKEVTLDIGDLKVAEVKYGTIIFTTTPSDATLYVDGEKINTSAPITLEYGIHQIIAKATGYQSLTTYVKVGSSSAGIDIELDKESTTDDDDDDDDDSYKVHVDAPVGAEVYLDGTYVGIAPVSFKKEAGTHNITLRMSGYDTRSYTVVIDSEEKDISYSFAELEMTTTVESLGSLVF